MATTKKTKKKATEAELEGEVGKQLADFDAALTLVQMAMPLVGDDAFDALMDAEKAIVDERSAFVGKRIRMVQK